MYCNFVDEWLSVMYSILYKNKRTNGKIWKGSHPASSEVLDVEKTACHCEQSLLFFDGVAISSSMGRLLRRSAPRNDRLGTVPTMFIIERYRLALRLAGMTAYLRRNCSRTKRGGVVRRFKIRETFKLMGALDDVVLAEFGQAVQAEGFNVE